MDCKNGKHDFLEIYSEKKENHTNIIRYCLNCGAIRIDCEHVSNKQDTCSILPILLPKMASDIFTKQKKVEEIEAKFSEIKKIISEILNRKE